MNVRISPENGRIRKNCPYQLTRPRAGKSLEQRLGALPGRLAGA